MLTGAAPFPGGGKSSNLRQAVLEDPTPPREFPPDLPFALGAVCLRATARDPARRYATAAELADDLRRFLSGRPVRARRYGVPERVALWARRLPEAAALVLLAGVVVAASALSIVQDIRQTRARNGDLIATLEREWEQERLLRAAVESERSAHHRARLRRYAAVVAQAGECWKGRIDLIRGPLAANSNPRPGEEDPREFAWHYLSGSRPRAGHPPQQPAMWTALPPPRRGAGSHRGQRWKCCGVGHGSRESGRGSDLRRSTSICFSPDGKGWPPSAIDRDEGRHIRVWETATGRLLASSTTNPNELCRRRSRTMAAPFRTCGDSRL